MSTDTNFLWTMNWKQYIPISDWLPSYPSKHISSDLLAGITVGIMVIPQGMAYGMLVGLPPIYGLYASLVPLIVYVLLGTSRQLVVGPTAMISLLVYSGISELAMPGTPSYISLVILSAFLVGCLQLLFGLFRLGFFINFLSHPVLSGFISAASIVIIISQLKFLTGVEYVVNVGSLSSILDRIYQYAQQIDLATFGIGLSGMVIIFLLKRIKKSIPGSLIVLILSIVLLYVYHPLLPSVEIVGSIPQGLPTFSLPQLDLEQIPLLLPSILTIALISILESIAIAKMMQAKHKDYELVSNQELRAIGFANMLGALFQGFPIAGSFSRTAINDDFGAKSSISALVAALVVGFTLLFLTPLFYYLPTSILAAIIIVAVLRLIDIKEVLFLWKSDRTDCFMLGITFLATLFIGIEQGILTGVFVSLSMVLYKSTRPHITILGRIPDTPHYKNIQVVNALIVRPDILIIRPDAPLFFANTSYFKKRLKEAVAKKKTTLRLIIFNADCIPHIDSSASNLFRELLTYYQQEGIMFYFTGVSRDLYAILKKSEVLPLLGGSYLFQNEQNAVDYFDKQVSKAALREAMLSDNRKTV